MAEAESIEDLQAYLNNYIALDEDRRKKKYTESRRKLSGIPPACYRGPRVVIYNRTVPYPVIFVNNELALKLFVFNTPSTHIVSSVTDVLRKYCININQCFISNCNCFIICASMKDSLKAQMLSRDRKLICCGRKLRIIPAQVQQQEWIRNKRAAVNPGSAKALPMIHAIATLDGLPREILHDIMGYLSLRDRLRLACVSVSLYWANKLLPVAIRTTPMAIYGVDRKLPSNVKINSNAINSLVRNAPERCITGIELTDNVMCSLVTTTHIRTLVSRATYNMTIFDSTAVVITAKNIDHIGSTCKNLRIFRIGPTTGPIENEVKLLWHKIPDLQEIGFRENIFISGKFFANPPNEANLETLRFDSCPKLISRHLKQGFSVNEGLLHFSSLNCHTITRGSLFILLGAINEKLLSFELTQPLVNNDPEGYSTFYPDIGHINLNVLNLSGCDECGAETLNGIFRIAPHLRILDVTGWNFNGPEELDLTGSVHLECIYMEKTKHVPKSFWRMRFPFLRLLKGSNLRHRGSNEDVEEFRRNHKFARIILKKIKGGI